MTPRLVAILGSLLVLTFAGLMVVTAVRRTSAPPAAVNEDHPGRALYMKLGCFRCHGISLEGTPKGPALVHATDHWDLDRLVRFLENPDSSAIADPRLAEQAHRFSQARMPAYRVHLDVLEQIAAFVLGVQSGQKSPG